MPTDVSFVFFNCVTGTAPWMPKLFYVGITIISRHPSPILRKAIMEITAGAQSCAPLCHFRPPCLPIAIMKCTDGLAVGQPITFDVPSLQKCHDGNHRQCPHVSGKLLRKHDFSLLTRVPTSRHTSLTHTKIHEHPQTNCLFLLSQALFQRGPCVARGGVTDQFSRKRARANWSSETLSIVCATRGGALESVVSSSPDASGLKVQDGLVTLWHDGGIQPKTCR